ncbi:MAG: hypothetical protein LBT92_00185 [Rickettsiales bacterium]|nr:hypothetical protein [Rickettsiales bacterium]
MNAKQKLDEIREHLAGRTTEKMLFPLSALKNFRPNPERKLSDFNYSVNALMFFTLAVADRLLDKVNIEFARRHDFGGPLTLIIDAATIDAESQLAKYLDWEKKSRADPKNINPSQVLDPREIRVPCTAGGAVHCFFAAADGMGLPYTRSLLKTPSGGWKPTEEEMLRRIRLSEPGRLSLSREEYMLTQDYVKREYFKHPEPEEPGWNDQLRLNMWQTTHAELTALGRKDPDAIEALYNNRFLTQFLAFLPFATVINDSYGYIQLRDYFAPAEGAASGGLPSFPPVSEGDHRNPSEFTRVDPDGQTWFTENMFSYVLELAYIMSEKPIYYRTKIAPGRRIRFGTGTKEYEPGLDPPRRVLEKLDSILRRREAARLK